MIGEHFRRKEPGLNIHATPQTFQTPLRFRLTSPGLKWKRGGLAFGILVGKIKVFSNEQKSTETPSKHQRESFDRSFQSTRTIRDPPGGLRPISLNVNFGQICKRTRKRGRQNFWLIFDSFKILNRVVFRCQMAQASFADSENGVRKWNRTSGGETAAEWKIQDFGKFRVWKSYFQKLLAFFQKRLMQKGLGHFVGTWNECI